MYCQIMVLYDEKQIYVSVPDFLDSTMRFDIDFSTDPSRVVRMVQEAIVRFFPVLEREDGRKFYIDKVDFRSNCFVVKYEGCPSGWSAIYKMKKPVFVLLKETAKLIAQKNYRLANADITIIAQRPKFRPYIGEMRQNIANALNVSTEQISVKATTTEELGFTGRGEGIAAEAVVLLQKKMNEF